MNITREQAIEYAKLLQVLIDIGEVSTILDTFINAFKNKTVQKADGIYYLHGNFNLGGTKSGRLSSSNINLQNLPSNPGKVYSKLIKQCFIAPPGNTRIDLTALSAIISTIK